MKQFAGFIMIHKHPDVLQDTNRQVLTQSLGPEKLLIVDNSETKITQCLVEGLGDARIAHYRVGYNAGPARSAKIGLQKLVNDGYQWIYWDFAH